MSARSANAKVTRALLGPKATIYFGRIWLLLGFAFLFLPIFALLLLGVYVFKQRTAISINKMIFLIFLFFSELLLLKSGFNRPNLHRVLMSSWPSVLIFLSIVDLKTKQHPVSKAASIPLNL